MNDNKLPMACGKSGRLFWVEDEITPEFAAQVINERGRKLEEATEMITDLREELTHVTAERDALLAEIAALRQTETVPPIAPTDAHIGGARTTANELTRDIIVEKYEFLTGREASHSDEDLDDFYAFILAYFPQAEASTNG